MEGYTVYGMICEVKSRILAMDNGVVMSVAGIAAAIFACFAVIVITKDLVSGENISIWKIVKPLAVLIVLPMFGTCVLALDKVTGLIADAIWVGVSNDSDNYDAKYNQLVAKVESIAGSDNWLESIQSEFSNNESIEGVNGSGTIAGEAAADLAAERADEKPWYGKLWDRLKGWASNMAQGAITMSGNIFSFIVSFLMNCVRYCLIGASGVYLTIL